MTIRAKYPHKKMISRRSILKVGLISLLATGCSRLGQIDSAGKPTLESSRTPSSISTKTVTPSSASPSSTATLIPETPIMVDSPVVQVASGTLHSLALLQNGQVLGWGSERILGLSDSSKAVQPLPIGLPSWDNVKRMYANRGNSIFITATGELHLVGNSNLVIPQLDGVVDVSADEYADVLIALRDDGTVWGVGNNEVGQLGNDAGGVSSEFVQIPIDNVIQVICVDNFVCALRSDGTVWGWGSNSRILGSMDVYTTPQQLDRITDITQIARGDGLNMLREDGVVDVWSSGDVVTVSDLPLVGKIAGRYPFYSFGITAEGGLWVWGIRWHTAMPYLGILPNDVLGPERYQAHEANLDFVVQITAGGAIIALDANNVVWGWKSNTNGQVGNGEINKDTIVSEPVPIIIGP